MANSPLMPIISGFVRERLQYKALSFRLFIALKNDSPMPEDPPVMTTAENRLRTGFIDFLLTLLMGDYRLYLIKSEG